MTQISNSLVERAFLSILLTNSSHQIGEILELLKPEEFIEPKHELIYTVISELYVAGKNTDPVSVVAHLNHLGQLNEAGGISYIRDIIAPTSLHTVGADPLGLALIIRDEALRRDLNLAGVGISQLSLTRDGTNTDEVISESEKLIFDIVNKEQTSKHMTTVLEMLPNVIEDARTAKDRAEHAVVGIPSGFPDLDKMTNGFKPGTVIIIAARPAVGKSTLAVDFARNACFLAEKSVLFFSLEMSASELTGRILSAESRVETEKIKSGDLDENDWMNIAEATERLKKGHFHIDDQPNTSISRVRSVAQRQKLRPEGLDMIVIDYLGLMEVANSGRANNRQNDVSELSRGIKLLSKELDVPIVLLSQLNRNSEERAEGKPKVSDLRESGSLEQDADMVLLIHRPEATDENNRPGEADLIVGKHRGGKTGVIPLTSMLSYCKFVPGQGTYQREPEHLSDGQSGVFATTEDEAPW